jgi:hypothetical protein
VSTPSEASTSEIAPPPEQAPQPLKYFRCPKGHEQQDTEEFSLRLASAFTGQAMYDTGPLCYRCIFDHVNTAGREYDEGGTAWYGAMFEFLTTNFQTHRIAPPEPQEITAEQMAAVVKAAEQGEDEFHSEPDFVAGNGVAHYRCLAQGCLVFISGDGPDLPLYCPDHADRPAGS